MSDFCLSDKIDECRLFNSETHETEDSFTFLALNLLDVKEFIRLLKERPSDLEFKTFQTYMMDKYEEEEYSKIPWVEIQQYFNEWRIDKLAGDKLC